LPARGVRRVAGARARLLVQEPEDPRAEANQSVRALTLSAMVGVAAPAGGAKLVLVAADQGADGAAVLPGLKAPFAIDFDLAGNGYVADMTGNRVWKIDPAGNASILAGTGDKGDSGDGGQAAKATLNGPHSLAVTPGGDVLV